MRALTEAEKRIVLDGVGVEEFALRRQIVDGLRGYCEAVHNLVGAHSKLQAIYAMDLKNSVIPQERVKDVLLGLTRTVKHLTEGGDDIPTDLWVVLLADASAKSQAVVTAMLKSA
jgi:hypothetical protein